MATTTDYGQCKRQVHQDGAWGTVPCGRYATGDDRLCTPHRNGKRASERARAKWDAEYAEQREAERREQSQVAYVRAWQAEHTEYVWIDGWTCPLCRRVLQEPDAAWLARVVADHQREHGATWERYEALGTPSTEREG